jgi:hypothetical protein
MLCVGSGVRHLEIGTAEPRSFEVGFSFEKFMRCESPGVCRISAD